MVGTAYGFSAYLIWGFLPLYFVWLAPTGPWEVVALRVLHSLVVCALLLTLLRGWQRLVTVLRTPRLLLWTAIAGILIYVNWQVFLIAAQTGHIIESSLGYFINPITTVLLAVLVLREKVRPAQWAAIGIAAVAVIVIVVAYGAVPWISLLLTASFGAYGLVKNRIGGVVDAVSGLAIETMWLTPVAIIQLVIVGATTGLTYGTVSLGHTVALSLAGIATATPLLLFAASARRVSLTTIGLLQFITPILQLLVGVLLLHEPMPVERWVGFGIIWVALIVLTVDMVRHTRSSLRIRRTTRVPQ